MNKGGGQRRGFSSSLTLTQKPAVCFFNRVVIMLLFSCTVSVATNRLIGAVAGTILALGVIFGGTGWGIE